MWILLALLASYAEIPLLGGNFRPVLATGVVMCTVTIMLMWTPWSRSSRMSVNVRQFFHLRHSHWILSHSLTQLLSRCFCWFYNCQLAVAENRICKRLIVTRSVGKIILLGNRGRLQACEQFAHSCVAASRVGHGLGPIHPWVGLGWVGLG